MPDDRRHERRAPWSRGTATGCRRRCRPACNLRPRSARLALDGRERSGYCPPRLSCHLHVLSTVPAIRNRPRLVCPGAHRSSRGSSVSVEPTAERGRRADRGAEVTPPAFASRTPINGRSAREGRPPQERQSVRWEEPCEGTTNPVATRLAACGSGSFWPRAPSALLRPGGSADAATRDRRSSGAVRGPRVGWGGADGQYYLYLSGEASALQGTDGLRARRGRLPGSSTSRHGEEPLYQVEVYAEGDVRHTGTKPRALSRRDRAIFARTGRDGGLQRRRDRAAALRRPARHPPGAPGSCGTPEANPPAARPPPRPPAARVAAWPPQVRRRRCRRHCDAIAATRCSPSAPREPKFDPMVVPAQMTRRQPPGPDDGPDDQGSGPAAAPPPRAAPQPVGRRRRADPATAGAPAVTGRRLRDPRRSTCPRSRARPASTCQAYRRIPRTSRRRSRRCRARVRAPPAVARCRRRPVAP